MMKWKVTKNSRSSSVDRSLDRELSEGPDTAKLLPALPGLTKAEQVGKDEDALLPPPRRKQQQNVSFGLSRKESFAASDCIPINLKEILGISRQRSESNLNSLPVLNGERRRSRSEVRISNTDRLAVAYHGCQLTGLQNKLTERNQSKTDKLPTPTGRCASPPMKNSRWLRGRQRQREPRKTMLGICGGVDKTVAPPNDKITNEAADNKSRSGSEIIALINALPTYEPKQLSKEINDKGKLKNSKDVNPIASRMDGDVEKELDKENIKTCRKPTSEGNKQCREGYRFRRNKGFAPRPGMRRNQNENEKTSCDLEDEKNDKAGDSKGYAENPSAKEKKDKNECEVNGVGDSERAGTVSETSCRANDDLDSQKDSDGDSGKHCAKKRRDSTGAVVTLTSEPGNDSKLSDACRQKHSRNKTTGVSETESEQKSDFTERNNERNSKYTVAAEKESGTIMPENSWDESTPNQNEHGVGKSEDLQENRDQSISSASKRANAVRNSECTAQLNSTRHCPEENSEIFPNVEEEGIYENVPNGDLTKYETVYNERDICVESKEIVAETMLDSLATVGEQTDCLDNPLDTCSQVKMSYPRTPPPKKKLASHQGMTVSVVVRKPSASVECSKPFVCKEPEISSSESFVVKKSFVLTIAKQEMGFRSMCASKESPSQTVETTVPGIKKEEHQISVTFLCSGNVDKPWLGRQASASPIDDLRLRSFSMPPVSRYKQQDLLCLESIRSRSRERRNREKQTIKRKSHRQRKKDPEFHMPKAVIDELSKVLEKRKRSIEDDDDEDDDDYDEYQDGDSE